MLVNGVQYKARKINNLGRTYEKEQYIYKRAQ